MAPDEPKEIMSQEEIDAYFNSVKVKDEGRIKNSQAMQQEDPLPRESERSQNETPGLSQDDIDALLSRAQTPPDPSGEDFSQNIEAPSEEPVSDSINAWDELDHNILSQQEIDALLSGFDHVSASGNRDVAGSETGTKEDHPEFLDDTSSIAGNNLVERLKHREDHIIRKKLRASDLLRELLKVEESRIRNIRAKKDELVNSDLYARYEITRPDRTKLVVSMSERTAKDYISMNPGSCMHRI